MQEDQNAAYKIVGTDSVGPVAGAQLRNQAVIATLLGLIGILFFIAFRYDWTYAAGAVIAVFHDVLITLAFFSMFQWEISLTVLAALLTLVGFSVNDSIVIFDRIRENLTLQRGESLYKLTNDSINQTMSRTIVTNGLVFLAVLALVIFRRRSSARIFARTFCRFDYRNLFDDCDCQSDCDLVAGQDSVRQKLKNRKFRKRKDLRQLRAVRLHAAP